MSVKPKQVNVKSYNEKGKENLNADINNGITLIGLKTYTNENNERPFINKKKMKTLINAKRKFFKVGYLSHIIKYFSRNPHVTSQVEVFQRSMKYFLLTGQCFGIFPMIDTSSPETPDSKYHLLSWRYSISFAVSFGQLFAAVVCFYKMTVSLVNLHVIAFFSFYFSNFVTNVLFIRLSTKWNYLIRQVASSNLNEYVDPSAIYRSNTVFFAILGLTLVEHILTIISKLAVVQDCYPDSADKFETFSRVVFPWLFDLKVTYSPYIGIYLLIQNLLSTLSWNFAHMFIVCISYYLGSVLEQVNKKILSHEGQYLPASYWRSLREDYNRAARLIRDFDDVINSLIFVSFACNLFFICLQLYHVLSVGINVPHESQDHHTCLNHSNGLFNGYEDVIYYTFSLAFVILRSFLVSIIAARVHSASLVAAPSLYNVPSPSYCTEVQRFIEQLHGDTVALSGLNFFYVTKELVLSVVGTIVTYELVLLQFNGD